MVADIVRLYFMKESPHEVQILVRTLIALSEPDLVWNSTYLWLLKNLKHVLYYSKNSFVKKLKISISGQHQDQDEESDCDLTQQALAQSKLEK